MRKNSKRQSNDQVTGKLLGNLWRDLGFTEVGDKRITVRKEASEGIRTVFVYEKVAFLMKLLFLVGLALVDPFLTRCGNSLPHRWRPQGNLYSARTSRRESVPSLFPKRFK
jgi:hypothetical protein